MVLFNILKIRKYFALCISWTAGIIVGGASMMYLLTIPDVVKLSALQISQVYVLVAFGIMFFAANVGSATAIFTRDILLRKYTR